jgi:hypothetical protein
LGRTLRGGVWNSFSVPFAVAESSIAGIFGEGTKIKKLTSSSYKGGELSLTFEDVGSIEAGKPYLILPQEDVVDPRFEDVTIVDHTTPTPTSVATFTPVINPVSFTPMDKSVLFMTGDGTVTFPTDDSQMKGFRAYFKLSGAAAGQ